MPTIHGQLTYPGLVSICDAQYTVSQGTAPGSILVRVNPQLGYPAPRGNAVFFDGNVQIPILDCKVESLKTDLEEANGYSLLVELVDHRWRWREQGMVKGCYNMLDPNGKLIPSYVRSPFELAMYCLAEMGESNFGLIDLPPGIPRSAGQNITEVLENGVNFPPSGLNPPINWNGTLAVAALNQVCDHFGRRVVYNPSTGKVSIVRPGIGASLPDGSVHKYSQGLQNPSWPDAVGVIGTETRYQVLLEMEAVGVEWNGQLKPIDQLSYAPLSPGLVQIDRILVTVPDAGIGDVPFFVHLKIQSPADADLYLEGIFQVNPSGSDTDLTVVAAAAAQINAHAIGQFIQATTTGTPRATLIISGIQVGLPFTVVEARWSPAGGPETRFGYSARIVRTQTAKLATPSWESSVVPDFSNVRQTDRLSFQQARELAQSSVFLMYRCTGRNADGVGMVNIPGYGRIVRRNQIVILPTKVDQMVPTVGEQGVLDRNSEPLLLWLYNGYSKDQPATAYGSVSKSTQGNVVFMLREEDPNTLPTDRIYTPFQVDPNWQMIRFSDYVYRYGPGIYLQPRIYLETAIHVRDPNSNQLVSFERVLAMEGVQSDRTRCKWEVKPDVQLNVRADYNLTTKTFSNVSLLEIDPIARADYYLAGMALQYQIKKTGSNEYNGLVATTLDGAIAQITWIFDREGTRTEVSRNEEHHPYIPPLPVRRRNERLSPASNNQIAAQENARRNPMG